MTFMLVIQQAAVAVCVVDTTTILDKHVDLVHPGFCMELNHVITLRPINSLHLLAVQQHLSGFIVNSGQTLSLALRLLVIKVERENEKRKLH